MFVIGFELEFISVYNRDEIRALLKTHFPKYKNKIKVEEDVTIRSNAKMPGRHEIITPPLPQKESMELLTDLFAFLNNNKCAANKTTGFHVNVSFEEKSLNKWLNPLHVVDLLDYKAILQKWDREKILYCRPFDFYFDIIWKRVKMLYKPKNWADPYVMMEYSAEEVQRLSEIKFISMVSDCSEEHSDKYTRKAYDVWDVGQGKHICMNLHYLKQRGYIEYRMIGGAKYLTSFDDVKEDIDTILKTMQEALKRSMDE
jgi:hypothetical protein